MLLGLGVVGGLPRKWSIGIVVELLGSPVIGLLGRELAGGQMGVLVGTVILFRNLN